MIFHYYLRNHCFAHMQPRFCIDFCFFGILIHYFTIHYWSFDWIQNFHFWPLCTPILDPSLAPCSIQPSKMTFEFWWRPADFLARKHEGIWIAMNLFGHPWDHVNKIQIEDKWIWRKRQGLHIFVAGRKINKSFSLIIIGHW